MSGRKKIGVVIYTNPDYYPVTAHAVELLSNQFDIVLIGRNQEPSFWKYPDNVELFRVGKYSSVQDRKQLSSKEKIQEYFYFVEKTSRLLRDVSLIYAYDSFGYVAAYICRFFLNKDIPIVYQNHEISDKLPSLLSLSGWIERLERLWINNSQMVIFPDRDRANHFKNVITLEQEPVIVPNFPPKGLVDTVNDWDKLINERWQNPTYFYRGTISDVSAMTEIIKASVTFEHGAIRFVGFLNDDQHQVLKEVLAGLDAVDRFKYLGKLPYQDLQAHTLNASLGFALYKSIDFNRTACVSACQKIYEYAACGLPAIVTDSPNYRNYLGDEEWVQFADPHNPQSIYEAMGHILKDYSSYRKMCLAAREAFEKRFNYESVFLPIITDFKELI